MEVTGPVRVVLYASSTATDPDFTAKLVDVSPCGFARNLTDGIVRARYREGTTAAKFLAPGKREKFTIDLIATANLFKAGHAIRVEISSSNFPRFDRNPNTGHAFGCDAETVVAVQTVVQQSEIQAELRGSMEYFPEPIFSRTISVQAMSRTPADVRTETERTLGFSPAAALSSRMRPLFPSGRRTRVSRR